MPDSVLSWIFIFAIGQGLFLSLALLGKRQESTQPANRLLAALVCLFVLVIGHAWLGLHHLFPSYPHTARAITALPFLFGPLLWLALRNLLHGHRLNRRSLIHFIPFLLTLALWLPYYLQSANAKRALLSDGIPWHVSLLALLKLLHFCAYAIACYRLLDTAPATHSFIINVRRLLRLLGIGLLLHAALFALEHRYPNLPLSSDAVGGLALMSFIYGLAWLSIRVPDSAQSAPKPRYAGSLLTPEQSAACLAALQQCMEQEHAYQDGELKLEQLAERLALTPHELSQLINASCNMNFQEYLNRYRVAALKAALQDPHRQHTGILELALEAGFNSKSTLNRAFKKHTGMTPSEFRSRQST